MTAPINPYRYRPEPTLTGPEAAEKAGIDYDIAKRLNRALGMPEIDDRSVEFGERDVEVLQILKEMISAGVPLDDVIAVARVYGQSFARIADAETRLFRNHFVIPMREQGADTEEIEEHFEPLVTRQLDLLGKAIDYVHRRHLAVALLQLTTPETPDSSERLAVGFVDLVDFSRITEDLHSSDLGELVDRFEHVVIEACSDPAVRVVKMIGDAAMFVSTDPQKALDAATTIVKRVDADDLLPEARSGLDIGDVVPVAGDYFGRTANVSARITEFARPGTTVVSDAFLGALGHDGVEASRIGRHRLRGVGRVELYKIKDHAPD
jgi:adenylate cyclase